MANKQKHKYSHNFLDFIIVFDPRIVQNRPKVLDQIFQYSSPTVAKMKLDWANIHCLGTQSWRYRAIHQPYTIFKSLQHHPSELLAKLIKDFRPDHEQFHKIANNYIHNDTRTEVCSCLAERTFGRLVIQSTNYSNLNSKSLCGT